MWVTVNRTFWDLEPRPSKALDAGFSWKAVASPVFRVLCIASPLFSILSDLEPEIPGMPCFGYPPRKRSKKGLDNKREANRTLVRIMERDPKVL